MGADGGASVREEKLGMTDPVLEPVGEVADLEKQTMRRVMLR